MVGKIPLRNGSFFCCAFFVFLAVPGWTGSPSESGRWKIYYNSVGQYCISYPTRWIPAEAFEGAGLVLKPGMKMHATSVAEIDVEALPNARAQVNDTAGEILLHELEAHLDGLKMFERAERVKLLEKRDMQFFGAPALFVKDSYYDAQERTAWVDELILAHRAGQLFRLELTSLADALMRYEPVFTRFASTFQFDCPARATPLDVHAGRAASAPSRPVAQSIQLYPQRGIR